MASRKETADFVLQQLGHPGRFTVRYMFGEYAVYADGKTVAFIYNDQLYARVASGSEELAATCEQVPMWPGSRQRYLVTEEELVSNHRLPQILLRMAEQLPLPHSQRKRAKRKQPGKKRKSPR